MIMMFLSIKIDIYRYKEKIRKIPKKIPSKKMGN